MSDVCYPDFLAQSPNQRYRLDVQSPMNGAIADRSGARVARSARAMQGSFRYALLDTHTGQTVWERWQETNEGSPAECVVGDDGWVAVRTHSFYPQLFLIDLKGAVSVRVKIRSTRLYKGIVIPVDDETWIDDRVIETSAGAYWADNSWRYFFQHDGQRYFAWRPYWGRRLVFHLEGERARRLSDEEAKDPRLLDTVVREEGDWAAHYVMAAGQRTIELQAFLSDTYENRCKHPPAWDHIKFLIPAVHLSGVHQRRECIAALLELESLSFVSSNGSCQAIGVFKGWSRDTEMFRPAVHHALRRMGQEPRGLPAFHYQERNGRRLGAMDPACQRRTIPLHVHPGMTPIETLERIGAPDDSFEGRGKDGLIYWDYDFLENGAWFTHRLVWSPSDAGNRLGEVQTIPGPWLTSPEREYKYLWG